MAKRIKLWSCRFRSSQRRGGSEGLVLVIVMMMAVLLLISLTAALPSVYQEGRRQREAELIFRGTQYGRAVALFHKQFNRYPTSVKELMGTNGMRFLRQEYADPMDPKGKWRFIHVNAAGVLLDSKNQPLNPQGNGNPAGLGQTGSAGSAFGGNSPTGSGSFQSGSSSMGLQGGFSSTGTNPSTGGSSQIGPTSSMFGNPNEIQGAFIAGVAATSHHESIRVWNKHQHYDEWEFLGIDMGIFGIQVGMPGGSAAPQGMGQQSPQQGFGSSTFGPAPTSPTSGPSTN
jgi:hypothetical protein